MPNGPGRLPEPLPLPPASPASPLYPLSPLRTRSWHILQRPRDAPTRTAFLAALMTVYGLFWAAGGNDILATHFHLSLESITYFMRTAVFVGPVLVFVAVRRWCLGLQRADQDRLLHGYESGIIMRSAEGGYTERHLPLSPERAYTLTARDEVAVALPAKVDDAGVRPPDSRTAQVRSRLSQWVYADDVPTPTAAELEAAIRHLAGDHAHQAGLDHPSDGHELDDHRLRDTQTVPLRGADEDPS